MKIHEYRRLAQRHLARYREELRRRGTEILKELLEVERLPERLAFRDIKAFAEAVLKGGRRVEKVYNIIRRIKPWLAKKWTWYLRSKAYWREKIERLQEEIERYEEIRKWVEGKFMGLLADLTQYMDGRPLTEELECAVYMRFRRFGDFLREHRKVVLTGDFMEFAVVLASRHPNRVYGIAVFATRPNKKAERESEDYGTYIRRVPRSPRRKWYIYYFVRAGHEIPTLVKDFRGTIKAMIIHTLDLPPIPKACRQE